MKNKGMADLKERLKADLDFQERRMSFWLNATTYRVVPVEGGKVLEQVTVRDDEPGVARLVAPWEEAARKEYSEIVLFELWRATEAACYIKGLLNWLDPEIKLTSVDRQLDEDPRGLLLDHGFLNRLRQSFSGSAEGYFSISEIPIDDYDDWTEYILRLATASLLRSARKDSNPPAPALVI